MNFEYPFGATPLNPDESSGLKLSYISTQEELNAAEQQNISKSLIWAHKIYKKRDILSDFFIRELHKHMFKDVWKWAGIYRTSDKSIGVDWMKITESISCLCSDTDFWIKNHIYSWDELGCRFHHKLVQIHPFSNGNGRHSRIMTDLILLKHNEKPFSWGSLKNQSHLRKRYIESLREADQRKFDLLIDFVRS